MRVLQINANYGFSSTGIIMKDIGDMLNRNSDEAFYAYQRCNPTPENGYVVGNEFDWKFHAVACRVFGCQGYYSSIATQKLIKHIRQIKPDIVHLHNLHSNYVNIDILFKFFAKEDIPVVITMHDCWYFTGKCFHYVDVDCDGYKKECHNCKKKKAPPASLFFDCAAWSLNNKKKRLLTIPRIHFVGCSKWIVNEARKGILADAKISHIYNGVDITIFRPQQSSLRNDLNIGNNYLVMGMANKWMQPSNIDLIGQIMTMSNMKIMIVGCTEEQIKKLKKYGDSVIPIGFINNRVELAKYYSAADVFVNLTHADTLPTVNMESICCGTPVITYNSCGSPELVDSETGIVVEENDQNGIVQALRIAQEKDWNTCAEVGKRIFDKNICYEGYSAVYRELLE